MRSSRLINRVVDALLVISLGIIVGILILQVILRYVFRAALPWPEELSQFLLILVSFLGMYRAIASDLHIRVKVLPDSSRSPWLKALRVAGGGAVCAFLAYIGYGGWSLAMSAWYQPSTALRLPMGIPYLIIAVGCTLSIVGFGWKVREMVLSDKDSGKRS